MIGKLLGIGATVYLFAAVSALAAPVSAPPNCAAIAFRPILANSGDGQQDAGLYRSRFGRIEVKASVEGGKIKNYFVEINDKPLEAVHGRLPGTVAACAKAKRLTPPVATSAACVGDQLTVVIEHSGEARYVALYAHRAGAWHFCSAGIS